MKISLYFAFLISLCLSCSSETEKKEQTLRKEIMDIHDELMPKMNDIQDLKIRLKEQGNKLTDETLLGTSQGTIDGVKIDSLIQSLEIADRSMMEWMENYNNFDEDSFTHEEQMAYLQEEKENIEEVRLKVLSSIIEAQAVLRERP